MSFATCFRVPEACFFYYEKTLINQRLTRHAQVALAAVVITQFLTNGTVKNDMALTVFIFRVPKLVLWVKKF